MRKERERKRVRKGRESERKIEKAKLKKKRERGHNVLLKLASICSNGHQNKFPQCNI